MKGGDKLVYHVEDRPDRYNRFGRGYLRPADTPPIDDDLIPNDRLLVGLAHGFRQQPAFIPVLLSAAVRYAFESGG